MAEGFATYKGRPIVSVTMEIARRADSVDAVYDIDDEFIIVTRVRVDKHVHEIQADGVHLTLKVAPGRIFRADEGEAHRLWHDKEDAALLAEQRRDDEERERKEKEAGVTRLPIEEGEAD